jgi:predicted dehydrogenase
VIGVGVAGAGWLGEALVRELPRFSELRLAAVQDSRAETAASIAERYGSAWHGDRFEDLLRQSGVDLVAICTPNAMHVPQARAALTAGKHVLVQKPLALSQSDAQAVIDLARQVERLLLVDYSYRFLDTMQRLREEMAEPRQARAVFHNIYGPGSEKAWSFDPKLSGGGALVDLGVHLIDLAVWLLEPREIRLESVRLLGEPVEHAASLRLRLDETPLEVEVSWNAPLPESQIGFEVEDKFGNVSWENVAGSFFKFRTVRGHDVLLERETTLREDTLRAVCVALRNGQAPSIDARVYAVLDQAYGRKAD